MIVSSRFVVVLFVLLSVTAAAEEQPHEHNGRLTPYTTMPPLPTLTEKDQRRLDKGRAVYKRFDIDGKKRGLAVFRVQAPAHRIWSVIKNFDAYPERVKGVRAATVYRREGDDIYVKFTATHWLAGKTVWYARHDYPNDDRDWGTWTLDYAHRSDLNDSVGFWRVVSRPGEPQMCDVYYSADVVLKGWTPPFVKGRLVKKGLRQATQWVREYAERG